MKEKMEKIVSDKRVIIAIFVLFSLAASVQSLLITKTSPVKGIEYNGYNNYTIFERSFHHLKNNQDLYSLYPLEHWDLYKYTPSFSVFFGFFSLFPDWLGLSLWNLLNALILLLAVYYLPRLNDLQKGLILLIVLIELMTSMQNEQSNGLIAGLIILSFGLLERDKPLPATLFIVFSTFVKLFGVVGFALFLFYPNKWKSALYSLLWITIMLLVPLLFVDLHQYLKLYGNYLNLLINDHEISYGYSVMGLLHAWFSAAIAKNLVIAAGTIVFLVPLFRFQMCKEFIFRFLLLCSILIWIVIFNHKAESPTFIIAMSGIAMWFIASEKNILNVLLFIAAFILTTLSPTDIFPHYLREAFVKPYVLKVLPCILIWLKIIYDMMKLKKEDSATKIAQ